MTRWSHPPRRARCKLTAGTVRRRSEFRNVAAAYRSLSLRHQGLFFLVLLALGTGFPGTAVSAVSEAIYEVNSYRVPCVGVGPMHCLQVRRESSGAEDWQNFYSEIRGFDYEPGYLYRLRVQETRLPPEQVPADASSIRYELLEIIEKSRDPRLAIHDIWALERFGESGPDLAGSGPPPYIEFNIPRSEYIATGGCGGFRGEILAVSAEELRLGTATGSPEDQGCDGDPLLNELSTRLGATARWHRSGLSLTLSDERGTALLTFRKID